MSKSDLMKWAHRWAREHREEFPRYADALSVGMKKAHAHKGEREREIRQEEENARKEIRPNAPSKSSFSFADLARRGVPFLCLDWKKEEYPYRKDFRELYSPPRDRSTRSAREGERLCL
jgi:excinuclease UvrABC helicase subunit UvrB